MRSGTIPRNIATLALASAAILLVSSAGTLATTSGIWYLRTVQAEGNGTGWATLYVNGVPLPSNPGDVTFSYQSVGYQTCPGTQGGAIDFSVSGTVNGANGAWNYLGIQFFGPGDPGILGSIPPNGPFVLTAHPSMGGTDASGVFAFDFDSYGGAAGGVASFQAGGCGDAQPEYPTTHLDLTPTCLTVNSFHWADTDKGLVTMDTAFQSGLKSGTTVSHAKVFQCKDGSRFWNPAVSSFTVD